LINRPYMSLTTNSSKTDTMIAQKYKIQKKVGSGAFGEIFKAINT